MADADPPSAPPTAINVLHYNGGDTVKEVVPVTPGMTVGDAVVAAVRRRKQGKRKHTPCDDDDDEAGGGGCADPVSSPAKKARVVIKVEDEDTSKASPVVGDVKKPLGVIHAISMPIEPSNPRDDTDRENITIRVWFANDLNERDRVFFSQRRLAPDAPLPTYADMANEMSYDLGLHILANMVPDGYEMEDAVELDSVIENVPADHPEVDVVINDWLFKTPTLHGSNNRPKFSLTPTWEARLETDRLWTRLYNSCIVIGSRYSRCYNDIKEVGVLVLAKRDGFIWRPTPDNSKPTTPKIWISKSAGSDSYDVRGSPGGRVILSEWTLNGKLTTGLCTLTVRPTTLETELDEVWDEFEQRKIVKRYTQVSSDTVLVIQDELTGKAYTIFSVGHDKYALEKGHRTWSSLGVAEHFEKLKY
jgi:hypothetical protein